MAQIPKSITDNDRIILFDGLCNLCSGLVSFIYCRDKHNVFRFAWAQEEPGIEIMEWAGLEGDLLETMIYVEDGKSYYKSTGVLKVARLLNFPWNLVSLGIIVPRFIRDWIYDRVSMNRYSWFGKREKCLVPNQEIRNSFL